MKTIYKITIQDQEIEILNPGSLSIPNLNSRLAELAGGLK